MLNWTNKYATWDFLYYYPVLCLSQALAVSDHYPVEVKLIGQAPTI